MWLVASLDTAEACIRSQAGLCEICGGTGGTGTGLSAITSVLRCQYDCSSVFNFVLYCPFQDKQAKAGEF